MFLQWRTKSGGAIPPTTFWEKHIYNFLNSEEDTPSKGSPHQLHICKKLWLFVFKLPSKITIAPKSTVIFIKTNFMKATNFRIGLARSDFSQVYVTA